MGTVRPDFSKATESLARPLAATKSEARNPKSETNPNHQNSKFKTNHSVLFRRWLWEPDSNIKQKKQEVVCKTHEICGLEAGGEMQKENIEQLGVTRCFPEGRKIFFFV